MTEVHKTAEEAAEDKARLLDLTNDAILVRDASDRITFWNKGATDMYGYSRDQAIGRLSHDLLRAEFLEPLESIKEKLFRDGLWAGEVTHTCAKGARKTVSTRWVVERDGCGDIRSILESNRDITESKRAEEAQNLLAAIVESSDDAIVSKGLDGIITSWKKAAERMFGYTANEAIGQSITLIIPPDRKDEEKNILARIGRGERIDHFQTVRRHKDGTLLDVSVTISPRSASALEHRGWLCCRSGPTSRGGLCRRSTWLPTRRFEPMRSWPPRRVSRCTTALSNWGMRASTRRRSGSGRARRAIRFWFWTMANP